VPVLQCPGQCIAELLHAAHVPGPEPRPRHARGQSARWRTSSRRPPPTPQGGTWVNPKGRENADICAWRFGSVPPPTCALPSLPPFHPSSLPSSGGAFLCGLRCSSLYELFLRGVGLRSSLNIARKCRKLQTVNYTKGPPTGYNLRGIGGTKFLVQLNLDITTGPMRPG